MGEATAAVHGRFAARRAAPRILGKSLKDNVKIACIGREFEWRCGGESVKKIAPQNTPREASFARY
jgi:hypothetical protein